MDGQAIYLWFAIWSKLQSKRLVVCFGGGRMNYFAGGYEGFLNANLKQVGTELVAIELDCDQTGWGLTPIIGADVKLGNGILDLNTSL